MKPQKTGRGPKRKNWNEEGPGEKLPCKEKP
jgi:hypothetical protein